MSSKMIGKRGDLFRGGGDLILPCKNGGGGIYSGGICSGGGDLIRFPSVEHSGNLKT